MQESKERTAWRGVVVSIHVTDAAGEPLRIVGEVRAVAGRGLEGDRYHAGKGFYSYHGGPERVNRGGDHRSVEAGS